MNDGRKKEKRTNGRKWKHRRKTKKKERKY